MHAGLDSDVARIVDAIDRARTGQGRLMVGIAGPPASGKSTLAGAVVQALNTRMPAPGVAAALLPMDGFHYSNEVLESRGLRARKGAPATFDVTGFRQLLNAVRANGSDVRHPVFDRSLDRVIEKAGVVTRDVGVVIVEGNYLFLSDGNWQGLSDLFDLTVMVRPPFDVLRARLVQRWLEHGYNLSGAIERVERNDLVNAHLVLEKSARANLELGHVPTDAPHSPGLETPPS